MEAHRLSTARNLCSGYSALRSSKAMRAELNVPDSPDEKPTYSTSKPSRAILPATSRNVSTLIWLVVDMAPPRSIS